MMAAPVGTNVGLYYDGLAEVEVGEYIRTKTGRSYLIDSVRIQQRGTHVGRQHLRCIVVAAEDIAPDATVHRMWWYRR